MNLQYKMRKLCGRHTRGTDKPVYFLLHHEDVEFIRDLISPEFGRTPGIEEITFGGVRVFESPLAKKGEPLVVMREPKEVEIERTL